uniref:DUF4371 domain-containing protein n=1 Tax=Bracon brevicornis TaxID=1563983 RepID=A0A6V7JGC1_9HYME
MNFIKTADCNEASTLNNQVRTAEIQLTGFFAEDDVSLRLIDKVVPTLKEIIHDSRIAEKSALKRTEATGIATNVIGETEKAELTEKLKKTKFSILTDESTDTSTTKTSGIRGRHYDEGEKKIVSKFWELSQVSHENGSTTSATGEHLYTNLIESFKGRDIPMQNIIGFGSDGCNVMMGEHNSVAS